MILVDTSVWIDHFRRGEPELTSLLAKTAMLCHPFVIGELALGGLRDRHKTMSYLMGLPQAPVCSNDAVLNLIELNALSGRGIGYVDAHLLAAAHSIGVLLWTRDQRLKSASHSLGLAAAFA